jgi:hypothetical protein
MQAENKIANCGEGELMISPTDIMASCSPEKIERKNSKNSS